MKDKSIEAGKKIANALNNKEAKAAIVNLVKSRAAIAVGSKLAGPVGMTVGLVAPMIIDAIIENYLNPKDAGEKDKELNEDSV